MIHKQRHMKTPQRDGPSGPVQRTLRGTSLGRSNRTSILALLLGTGRCSRKDLAELLARDHRGQSPGARETSRTHHPMNPDPAPLHEALTPTNWSTTSKRRHVTTSTEVPSHSPVFSTAKRSMRSARSSTVPWAVHPDTCGHVTTVLTGWVEPSS